MVFILVAHSDKEQWEPTLEALFVRQFHEKDPSRYIKEAFAFDWQSHGDAALINQIALKDRPEGVCESTVLFMRSFAAR